MKHRSLVSLVVHFPVQSMRAVSVHFQMPSWQHPNQNPFECDPRSRPCVRRCILFLICLCVEGIQLMCLVATLVGGCIVTRIDHCSVLSSTENMQLSAAPDRAFNQTWTRSDDWMMAGWRACCQGWQFVSQQLGSRLPLQGPTQSSDFL